MTGLTLRSEVKEALPYLSIVSPFAEHISAELGRSTSSSEHWVAIAVSSLNAFLQINYTGPELAETEYRIFEEKEYTTADWTHFEQSCIAELEVDSEEAYTHTKAPYLLILAISLLVHALESEKDCPERKITTHKYLARAYMVHQSLLSAPAATLHDKVFTSLQASAPTADTSRVSAAEYYLELARANLVYSHDSNADIALRDAQKASGMVYMVTGMKAKRTKYQQREVSNLVVLAKSSFEHMDDTLGSFQLASMQHQLPQTLSLDSELLLERPSFSSTGRDGDEAGNEGSGSLLPELEHEDPNSPSVLSDIDNCILLLTAYRIKQSSPAQNPLVAEQLLAYISRIIAQSTGDGSTTSSPGVVNWSIFSRALWYRSLLESSSAKTVERGVLQLASLVDELGATSSATAVTRPTSPSESAPAEVRLKTINILPLLPRWKMNLELASQYLSLGMIKSAQEIYSQLELPVENALCMAAAGSGSEAVRVLQNYIVTDPPDRPRALSVLGDITGEPEYWEKAWEAGKYASAKRSLGEYYFKRGKPETAIAHLSAALKKNPLHKEAWFLYGCAGLESEQYELAAEGFTRCVSMDSDDPKAWSNLATALLHVSKETGGEVKSKEALTALAEACRLDPDDWRLWNNLVLVSARLENWTTCLRATTRLIELRASSDGEASLDMDVLRMLAQHLVSDVYSAADEANRGRKQSFFERQAVQLFTDTIPKLATHVPELWKLVAKVELWRKRPWAALDAYEKMFRSSVTVFESDETNESKWNSAVDACELTVDGYINLGELPGRFASEDDAEGQAVVCKDWKWRAKGAVRSLMSKGKRIWENSQGWDRLIQMRDDLK